MLRWIVLLALLAALVWIFTHSGDRGAAPAHADTRSSASARRAQTAELVDAERAESEQRRAVDPAPTPAASSPGPSDSERSSEFATLTVLVLMPDGTPWSDAQVHVVAGPRSLSDLRFDMKPRGDGRWRQNRRVSNVLGGFALIDVDEHGRADLQRVTPRAPLELRASDVLGTVGARAERVVLEPGEQRTLELKVDSFPRVLRGRCRDASWIGVADAAVSVGAAFPITDDLAATFQVRSDAAGEFTTRSLLAAHVAVHAEHTGRIASTSIDTAARAGIVELFLEAARSLRVEVRDSAGEPYPNASVSIHETTGAALLETPRTTDHDGILFTALPRRPLELRWGSRCAPQSQLVAEHLERALVVAPRDGELELHVGALPGDERTRYAAVVQCTDGGREVVPACSFFNNGDFDALWTLAPGDYALKLMRLPNVAEEPLLPWGESVRVTLRTGETTRVRLGD